MTDDRATWKYKVCLTLFFAAAYMILYVVPNFYPIFSPRHLPLLGIDRSVPLIPWTFIIYLSDYLLALTVILSITSLEKYNSLARTGFTVLVLSGLCFIFFPTTYPRPSYPTDQPWIVGFFMNLVGGADTPNNCFPSMHVAITGVLTYAIRYSGTPIRLLYLVWSLLIFASTLTTKQHYFVDILGGILVASVAILLEEKCYRQERVLQTYNRLMRPLLNRINN